jgi:hypothetical protein
MNHLTKNKILYFLLLGGIILVIIAILTLIKGDFKEFFRFEYNQDSTESASGLELFLTGLLLIVISIWRLIKNKEIINASR